MIVFILKDLGQQARMVILLLSWESKPNCFMGEETLFTHSFRSLVNLTAQLFIILA